MRIFGHDRDHNGSVLPLLFASILGLPAVHAAVCNPDGLHGAYGFSLTGTTAIGDAVRPVAVLGRLVFDDSGEVSGVATAGFSGLIFGNPVTGKYEAYSDCSMKWTLQDDSGAFQHFAGTMSAEGGQVAFRQTDPGGAQHGLLLRTMEQCSEATLAGEFELTGMGSVVDINSAVESGHISLSESLISDGAGGLSYATAPDGVLTAGNYEVQDDCFTEFQLEPAEGGNEKNTRHFRAILVEKGRALGIETDPGTVVSLQLISR